MKKINSESELRSNTINKKVIVNLTQIDEHDYGEEKLMHSHSNPNMIDINRITKFTMQQKSFIMQKNQKLTDDQSPL